MKTKDETPVPTTSTPSPPPFPVPLHRAVLIRRVKLEIENTIILPASATSPQNEGIVEAVAPDAMGHIAVGDRVVYNNCANQYIIYQDVTYQLVHENDVYAKVTTDADGLDQAIPYNKQVLVDRAHGESITTSGVILPNSQTVVNVGKVLAVGPNCKFVKEGDHIVFSIYADFNFMFRAKTVYSMSEVDCLCVLPPDAFSGNQDLGRERRNDVPLDKLPDIEPSEDRSKLTGTKTFYKRK